MTTAPVDIGTPAEATQPFDLVLHNGAGRAELNLPEAPQAVFLVLTNRSAETLEAAAGASIALRFRPATVCGLQHVVAAPESRPGWSVAATEAAGDGMPSLTLTLRHARALAPGEALRVHLKGLAADPRGGSRTTRIDASCLGFHTPGAPAGPGHRLLPLNIRRQRSDAGEQRPAALVEVPTAGPLSAGFVGGTALLNGGVALNQLRLRLVNTSGRQLRLAGGASADDATRLLLSHRVGTGAAPWGLLGHEGDHVEVTTLPRGWVGDGLALRPAADQVLEHEGSIEFGIELHTTAAPCTAALLMRVVNLPDHDDLELALLAQVAPTATSGEGTSMLKPLRLWGGEARIDFHAGHAPGPKVDDAAPPHIRVVDSQSLQLAAASVRVVDHRPSTPGGAMLALEVDAQAASVHSTSLPLRIAGEQSVTIEASVDSASPGSKLLLQPGGGRVGIGTPDPANALSVKGDADVSGRLVVGTAQTESALVVAGECNLGGLPSSAHIVISADQIQEVSSGSGKTWDVQAGALHLNLNGGNVILAGGGKGKVGIGTVAPNVMLDVGVGQIIGNSTLSGSQHDAANRGMKVSFGHTVGDTTSEFVGMRTLLKQSTTKKGRGNAGDISFDTWECDIASREVMRISGAGKVGIGSADLKRARLEVVGSETMALGASAYFNKDPTQWETYNVHIAQGAVKLPIKSLPKPPGDEQNSDLSEAPASYAVTIYASENVAATGFTAFSDRRIKHLDGPSDAAADLATLMRIEVTDYRYVDKPAKGAGRHKKVIAQQVEAVYPQAVHKTTDVVPDIYQQAALADGWLTLATDLRVGERVRLIAESGAGIHEVLEVRDGAFRTAFAPANEEIFVYGREVDDFGLVDYEALAMLNVSATQELARRLAAQDAEIAMLRARVSSQDARQRQLEARLERLEHAALRPDRAIELAPAPAHGPGASGAGTMPG